MALPNASAQRIVVKIGTNTLTSNAQSIDVERVQSVCSQIAALRERGIEVIVVSSGAIGLGMGALKLTQRPRELPMLQACAAIGQTLLMETWQKCLQAHQLQSAQILLTREDVQSRERHVAVRDTVERLLSLGAIPIVNENDTVSAAEIKFGDNDILSALVASLSKADLLVILSVVTGMMDREKGTLITLVEAITPELEAMAGGTDNPRAVGGMITKVEAAKVATRSGCGVFIGNGRNPSILIQLITGEAEGTFFMPQEESMASKKRWLAFFGRPKGTVTVDSGAVKALRDEGGSLLAKGVTDISGDFTEQMIVNVAAPDGKLIARGSSNYASSELKKISGQNSEAIRKVFPERKRLEVIHRDQMVIL